MPSICSGYIEGSEWLELFDDLRFTVRFVVQLQSQIEDRFAPRIGKLPLGSVQGSGQGWEAQVSPTNNDEFAGVLLLLEQRGGQGKRAIRLE